SGWGQLQGRQIWGRQIWGSADLGSTSYIQHFASADLGSTSYIQHFADFIQFTRSQRPQGAAIFSHFSPWSAGLRWVAFRWLTGRVQSSSSSNLWGRRAALSRRMCLAHYF